MDDQRTRGFRIDFSDDEPDEPFAAPEPDKEPDRPSSLKPALISLFAFCVLGGLLFAGYYQLSNRINRIDTSGTHEIKGLRSQIDARLDDFSATLDEQTRIMDERFKRIEERIQQNAAALGKFNKQLDNTQENAQSVPSIINRLSAYIAEVDQLKADMEARISGLSEQVKAVEASMAQVNAVQAELDALRENIRRTRGEIEKLASARMDPQMIDKTVNQAVSDLRVKMNRDLDATQRQIEEKLVSLQDQLNAMDQIIKTLRDISRSPAPLPGQTAGPGQQVQPPVGSGRILEQEIE